MKKREWPLLMAEDFIDHDFQFKIYRTKGRTAQAYHAHDYIQMWYVLKGECIHVFNEKEYPLGRGNVFVLPPGVPHALRGNDDNTELFGLEFTDAFIIENMDKNTLFDYGYIQPFIVSLDKVKPTFPLEGVAIKVVEELLFETLEEFSRKNEFYKLFVKANLLKILAIITREYARNIGEEQRAAVERYKDSITDAIDYIDKNLSKRIYVEELCRLTAMSPAYFSYLFKHVTGMTFSKYLNSRRIEKAKELLKNSGKTVEMIAFETGYSSTPSFDRAFKGETGETPLQFRKRMWKMLK